MSNAARTRNTDRAAGYYVDHNSHGYSLILEFGNGEAESLGLFPTRLEATEARDALKSLRAGR